jgi:hypothetical protein
MAPYIHYSLFKKNLQISVFASLLVRTFLFDFFATFSAESQKEFYTDLV